MTDGCLQAAVPGEVVLKVPDSGVLRLGPGLVLQGDVVVASKAGLLQRSKNHAWVDSRMKRYVPSENDVVVGTILDRHGETYIVDIGGPFLAQLPQLSFEGATRRNRPTVKSGDLVYARVVAASRDIEPQLSCVDALGRASGFGHLKDGSVISLTTSMARQLLSTPPAPVLQALGASLQFELAVGLNGRVWVAADSSRATVLVANAIAGSEFLTPIQVQTFVGRLLQDKLS